MCFSCQGERHNNHKILNLKEIKPNKEKINDKHTKIVNEKSKINEFIHYLELLKENINIFISNQKNKLNNYIQYYNILLNLLYNLDNYENIKNIINFNIKKINKDTEIYYENIRNKTKYFLEEEKKTK